jgi:hypothetical protein
MQFDPLDKKIREAADHHHPAYDEHAWKKMRRLLDRHMPQKERKRRFLILIPLFLLLGGGSMYLVFRPGTGKPGIAEDRNKSIIVPKNDQPASEPKITAPVSIPVVDPVGEEASQQENGVSVTNALKTEESRQEKPVENEPITTPVTNLLTTNKAEPASVTAKPVADLTKTGIEEVGKKTAVEQVKTEQQADPVAKENKKKPAANRFFFYASAGPDLSFTRQMGDTRMLAGAGAGFNIRDRFMIRTGLFTARKVYSASPDEYDPPAAFWNYYPNLEKVDADCKVYELPVLLSYQFGRTAKQSWMATAGISTLFMKEEKYRYYYKPTPSSPLTTRDYTLKNESDHPFSVITLSGGYKRNLGKKVTLMAEPYVKLPLSGVGYGKVKLNSGGIMVSVGISPF